MATIILFFAEIYVMSMVIVYYLTNYFYHRFIQQIVFSCVNDKIYLFSILKIEVVYESLKMQHILINTFKIRKKQGKKHLDSLIISLQSKDMFLIYNNILYNYKNFNCKLG